MQSGQARIPVEKRAVRSLLAAALLTLACRLPAPAEREGL
jgi:hypothetical protein